jgi:hypothetical protein
VDVTQVLLQQYLRHIHGELCLRKTVQKSRRGGPCNPGNVASGVNVASGADVTKRPARPDGDWPRAAKAALSSAPVDAGRTGREATFAVARPVLAGRIKPGGVFDDETDLPHVAAAMDERQAIKSLIRVGT